MDLKIIEPIHSPLKIFENAEDFNDYYKTHKKEFDDSTTHLLNKKYKIEGYRITKIKGETMLKLNYADKNNNNDIYTEINNLRRDFEALVITVNKLIDKFNEHCDNV